MQIGKETWKWALVVILLAVFILLAKQAYISLTEGQDIPPPTDYLQGDSWDSEHKAGPGAGQPIEVPTPNQGDSPAPVPPQSVATPEQPPLEHTPDQNWDTVDDPGAGQ